MVRLPSLTGPARVTPAGLRSSALLWALLHVPLTLALYLGPIRAAAAAVPSGFRAAYAPAFVVQAAVLALLTWALALPLSRLPRVYANVVPALTGAATVLLAIDGRVLASAGFHLNGFILRVLFQPGALGELGMTPRDLALAALAAAAWLVAEVLAGRLFIRRLASPRGVAVPALVLLLAGVGERVYGAVLTEFGGPAIFAASGVLPLQAPVRMHTIVSRLRGSSTPVVRMSAAARLPEGLAPAEVRFTRRPDVVFVLAESLPAAHLDARTMPRLSARAEGGGRFTRHYAGASSTNYALFTLFYGLQAQKLEATVGAGRKPLLFPALRENGYDLRLLAASCVDWMDLQDTVFAGAADALRTWCSGPGGTRDEPMLAAAREWVEAAPAERPLFLLLFFNGTHFPYFYEDGDRVVAPDWDGEGGGVAATRVPGPLLEARARNAAHALDRRLDAFLSWLEARRGAAPIVLFTGDHGEEFRQKGHIGHGSDVVNEQIHVPFVLLGPGVPTGTFDAPTSHVDLVPTLFELLGDGNPAARYSDGLPAHRATDDRFVVSTVGWEPQYAVVGKTLKVKMYAGSATAQVTDPDDRPLSDGDVQFAASAAKILRTLRGERPAEDGARAPGTGKERPAIEAHLPRP